MNVLSRTVRSAILIGTIIALQIVAQTYQYPFQNPSLPRETRIADLVSRLTQSDLIALLNSSGVTNTRLGFTTAGQVEGYHGAELPSSPSTQICQAYGMGETWDSSIIASFMAEEALELRYVGQHGGFSGLIVRAPNCDLGRDPRWGRTYECFGEDPFLVGMLTRAVANGLQGNDTSYIDCACLMKHFLANSYEDTRISGNNTFDARLLREYYSATFRMGTEAGAECMMAAYNSVNGIPCGVLPILKVMARNEWGMNGVQCTDGGALAFLVTAHHYYPDTIHAVAGCIKAGISEFLDGEYPAPADSALNRGLMTIQDVDTAVANNLRMFFRLGLFDPSSMVPYANAGSTAPWTLDTAKNLCKLVTEKSIVLLKNSQKLLPLSDSAIKSIAVIGTNADSVCIDWYSGTPPYKISAYAGIQNRLAGTGVTVNYSGTNALAPAVTAAKASTVALVVVGNNPDCDDAAWGVCPSPDEGKEQCDRDSITLKPTDDTLIKAVYAANPNTIVLLLSSFPYAINWAQANVPAILHMTHNSDELGNALAAVLFGDYNPGGKTSQTWVTSVKELPTMSDFNIRDGRTYMYYTGTPLYPFGYGLSYTTFEYSNLQTSAGVMDAKNGITVSWQVTNTGSVAGEEIAQMYVKHLNSTVSRPIKELRGFRRVAIAPGQTQTISLSLPGSYLAYWDSTGAKWDSTGGTWRVENDNIQIQIGASSADIKLDTTLQVINGGPIGVSSVREPSPVKAVLNSSLSALSDVEIVRGPTAGLRFHLNVAANIDLRIYGMDGRLIASVSMKNLSAGTHIAPLPRISFSSGVYFVSGATGTGQKSVFKCFVR
jgi:beta-glucosidase